jgi:hypothetical protein
VLPGSFHPITAYLFVAGSGYTLARTAGCFVPTCSTLADAGVAVSVFRPERAIPWSSSFVDFTLRLRVTPEWRMVATL